MKRRMKSEDLRREKFAVHVVYVCVLGLLAQGMEVTWYLFIISGLDRNASIFQGNRALHSALFTEE